MPLLQIKKCDKVAKCQVKGNQWQNRKQNSALQSETDTLSPANSAVVLALSGSDLMLCRCKYL